MSRWMLASVLSLLAMAGALAAPISTARQEQLHNLLVQDCGSCHGLTMRGGLGPALLPDRLRGQSRAALIDTVMLGRPGTAMPPWNTMLSREEAAWMVDRLLEGINSP
ncbi:MAG: cytochrome c [Thiogranum sp.]